MQSRHPRLRDARPLSLAVGRGAENKNGNENAIGRALELLMPFSRGMNHPPLGSIARGPLPDLLGPTDVAILAPLGPSLRPAAPPAYCITARSEVSCFGKAHRLRVVSPCALPQFRIDSCRNDSCDNGDGTGSGDGRRVRAAGRRSAGPAAGPANGRDEKAPFAL